MTTEKRYSETVGTEHRKMFGQFFTPLVTAKFMLRWLLEKNPAAIYDPAFGMGAFYEAAKAEGFKGQFIGTEIDKTSFDFYVADAKRENTDLVLSCEDYFSDWHEKSDAIICNPPYLKFQKFRNRHEVLKKLSDVFGEKISGYTNTASAFLLKSVMELKAGGRLAYIMPFEFLNTGYGKVVKKILLREGSIKKIIRVTDEMGIFPTVMTTVSIIFFEKTKRNRSIMFSNIYNAKKMEEHIVRKVSVKNISSDEKWFSFFENRIIKVAPQKFTTLSFYGNFKRGIATGANDFFALTKVQATALKIPSYELAACITKSTQIQKAVFTAADLADLIEKNAPVYLFSADGKKMSAAALEYISYGERQGFDKRFLTAHRNPWHSTEKRDPFPILFGVFSRNGCKVIKNETSALTLTCFHGFSPKPELKKYTDKIFVFLKSDLGDKMIFANKRQYGQSLDKFEPSDLNGIFVPSPSQFDFVPDDIIKNEIKNIKLTGYVSDKTNGMFNKLFLGEAK